MPCNCSKKKLVPSGKKNIKKTSKPKPRMSVKPTRRIIRRTTR